MIRQPLGNLCIGDGFFLFFIQSEFRHHFRIDVFNADNDVLLIPGHEFGMPDVFYLSVYYQTICK